MKARTGSLDQLCSVFWLRPETALWREIDIRTMANFEFHSPSLDLGCGDGLFSFIRAGGALEPGFDAFRSVIDLDRFFENVDVFNSFDDQVTPLVKTPPRYKIDVGFDHKENLLKKAGTLGLYSSLKHGDANGQLPFDDASFNSIFSNIVYWLDDIPSVIAEISRLLRPGGTACLMLPNRTLPEFSFYRQHYLKTHDARWKFLEMLDRGRFSDNIRQAKNENEWRSLFENAGLEVFRHSAHLSKLTIQIWDIGLRPIFPLLLEMANSLPQDRLLAIKEKWINTIGHFIEPLVALDASTTCGEEPAFHCFELRKPHV